MTTPISSSAGPTVPTGAAGEFAPAPPGSVPGPGARPPASRRRVAIIAAVVAVAAVVVLAVLAFSGVFNASSSGSGANDTPVAYSAVAALSSTAGQSIPGGPWNVVAAEGIGVPNEISQTSPEAIGGGKCTYSTVDGSPTNVSIPATPSGTTPGKAAVWVFFAKNASLDSVLLISVVGGTVAPLTLVTGCPFVSDFTDLNTIASVSVVDSTAVASEFDQAGGDSFLGNHTLGVQLFILIGGSTFTGGSAVWDLEYSTCVVAAASGPGSWVTADYYAGTGVAIKAPSTVAGTCS